MSRPVSLPLPGVRPYAATVIAALEAHRDESQLEMIRKRLAPEEPAFGIRMRDLFDVAKAHAHLGLDEVDRLLDEPGYEPRMAAMCILDFQARQQLAPHDRDALSRLYLRRHDRISTWDMVDRAAPRVVGGPLVGLDKAPLRELAASDEPLRRRTAMTAPLYFIRNGTDTDLAHGFELAATLAGDPEPVVFQSVGIFLKHAGTRDEGGLLAFLAQHGDRMPARARRLAAENLA